MSLTKKPIYILWIRTDVYRNQPGFIKVRATFIGDIRMKCMMTECPGYKKYPGLREAWCDVYGIFLVPGSPCPREDGYEEDEEDEDRHD